MDDKPKLQPYGDIVVVTGKYMKDGKERNRYKNIGTLFATPHFSNISIKLEALPLNSDGWLRVFPREGSENMKPKDDGVSPGMQKMAKDVIHEVGDEPISLDDIPF